MRGASSQESGAVDFVSRSHAFFGRQAELDALVSAVASVRPGRPLVRLVVGSQGVGKSALLERAARRLAGAGALILASRCRPHGGTSVRAMDGLLDALVRHLAGLPAARLAALVPAHAELMGRTFPALLRLSPFARAEESRPELHPLEQRNRAFIGLRALLGALCSERPVVVLLDDVHWVDPDSLALLRALLTGPNAPALALLAALYPEGEPGPSEQALSASELRRLLATTGQPLELKGLEPAAALAFAQHLLAGAEGQLEASAAAVARDAAGHPRLIEQWVMLLKESPDRMVGASLQDVLTGRLTRLRPAARALAALLGLAEGPVPLRVLTEAAALPHAELEREVAALRTSRLCRVTAHGDQQSMELSHERVRAVVATALTEAERTARHAALAAAYEAVSAQDEEAFASHLQHAGQTQRAAAAFSRAGDRALEALSFARAARLYRKANALTGAATEPERHARLGDALTSWGRVAEGGRAYLQAAGEGRTLTALQLRRRAAEQLLVSGQRVAGHHAAAQLIRDLGLPIADNYLLGLLRTSLRWLKLRASGTSFKLRDASEVSAAELLRVDACWSLFVGFASHDPLRAQDPLSLNIALALKCGEPVRVARGLAGLAIVLEMTRGQSARAQELIERAEALTERIDCPHVRGLCALHAGIRAFNAGHPELARGSLEQAEQAFQEGPAGSPWERSITQFLALLCHMASGDLATTGRLARDWHEEAQARDDLVSADNLRVRVLPSIAILEGDLASARRFADPPVLNVHQSRLGAQAYWREVSLVECDLFSGDGGAALRRVRALWPALKHSTLLMLRAVHIEAHWLRARALLAALDAGERDVSSQELLDDIIEVEQAELAGARGIGAALRGALHARRGERDRSREAFASAELALADSGRQFLAKLARLRRGLLDQDESAARVRSEAELWLAGAGAVDTLGILRTLMPGGLAPLARP